MCATVVPRDTVPCMQIWTSPYARTHLYAPTYPRSIVQVEGFLHEEFGLSDTEHVLDYFSCALQRGILQQGWMYVTYNLICFYANIFGQVTKEVAPTPAAPHSPAYTLRHPFRPRRTQPPHVGHGRSCPLARCARSRRPPRPASHPHDTHVTTHMSRRPPRPRTHTTHMAPTTPLAGTRESGHIDHDEGENGPVSRHPPCAAPCAASCS